MLGLPTEFTFVSINKLATASGSGARDVEFDIFASELIQSVTVQKSPTAADEEGGIAGSVAIRTARPFDNPGLRLVGSAEGAYNSIPEKIDPSFSFLASNTFGDLGVLLSVAKQQRTNRTDSNSGINFRPIAGLKPSYADQWEVGVEKYLGRGGVLSASYFWKKIKDVVQSQLTGVVPDVTVYNANGTVNGVYDFDVYQPVNAEGSYDVSGIELNAVIPFGMFADWADGFGINANATFLDSSLTSQSSLNIPTAPIGLSDNSYNATVFYDKGPISVRVSYNRKSKYVERIERNMYPVYRDAYGQFDVAATRSHASADRQRSAAGPCERQGCKQCRHGNMRLTSLPDVEAESMLALLIRCYDFALSPDACSS